MLDQPQILRLLAAPRPPPGKGSLRFPRTSGRGLRAESVPAPPRLRAGAPLGLRAGSRLRAPFASPRDAQLSFAGDGVDSRRCTGHIEVERKLRALRLEQ